MMTSALEFAPVAFFLAAVGPRHLFLSASQRPHRMDRMSGPPVLPPPCYPIQLNVVCIKLAENLPHQNCEREIDAGEEDGRRRESTFASRAAPVAFLIEGRDRFATKVRQHINNIQLSRAEATARLHIQLMAGTKVPGGQKIRSCTAKTLGADECLTSCRHLAQKPRVRSAAAARLFEAIRWKSCPAFARRPYGRRAAAD